MNSFRRLTLGGNTQSDYYLTLKILKAFDHVSFIQTSTVNQRVNYILELLRWGTTSRVCHCLDSQGIDSFHPSALRKIWAMKRSFRLAMEECCPHRESSEDLLITSPLRFAKAEVPPSLIDVPREIWQLILTSSSSSSIHAFSSYSSILSLNFSPEEYCFIRCSVNYAVSFPPPALTE